MPIFRKKNRMDKTPAGYLFSNAALTALIIPLVVEQVLGILVGMADSVMVAGAGEAALSAVSLVDQINAVILNLFIAFATGGAVVASQYIGAKKHNEANRSASQLLLILAVTSVVLMAVMLIFKRGVISLLFGAIEADVMENSLIYLTITVLSFPFIALLSGANALFRSMNSAGIIMKTSVIINIVNVVGNAVFIYGFDMGVAGAAYGTLIARFVGCVLALLFLVRSRGIIRINLKKSDWVPNRFMIGKIMRIGIPSGLENSFFQIGRTLVLGVVSVFGTSQIAANAVANTLSGFVWMPAAAINLAIVTVIGQCVGAQDKEQTHYYVNKMVRLAGKVFLCTALSLVIFLPLILIAYNLTADTQKLVYVLLTIYTIAGIISYAPAFSIPNVLRAANDVTYTMTVSIFSMLIFRVGGSYLLGLYFGLGAVGVWISMISDWLFRAICFMWRLLRKRWMKKAFTGEIK